MLVRISTVLFCSIVFCHIGLSQNRNITLEQGFFGNQYHSNGVRLTSQEVRDLLKDFPEQRDEFTSGIRQRNIGNTIGLIGNASLLASLSFDSNGRGWNGFNSTQKGIFIGGFGLAIIGAIIAEPGEKKVIWSYKDYARQELLNSFDQDRKVYALVNYSLHDFGRRKLTLNEHRELLQSSPTALKKFNSSVTLNTISLTSISSSLVAFITMFATTDSGDDWSDLSGGKKAGIIGSLVGLLGGSITGLIARSKRKTSIHLYDDDCNCIVQSPNAAYQNLRYWSIGPTNNGMGFAYNF